MKPKFAIAAAAAALASLSAQAGQSQFGLILTDKEFGYRSLMRHTHTSATELTIRRAIADDVVGVYCEWDAKGSVHGNAKRLVMGPLVSSNPDGAHCRPSLPGDVDVWAGVPETDIRILYPDHKTVVEPTPYAKPNNAILEKKKRFGDAGRSQIYQREWDFAGRTVCLTIRDSNSTPPIDEHLGCFDIPGNAHAEAIRQHTLHP